MAGEIIRDRTALNVAPSRRRRLNASIGIRRIEVDDVAQKDLAAVKLITPDGDSLKCERAFTKPRHHSLAAGLDTLGDCNFTFTRKELHRAHVAEIDAKWVIGAFRLSLAGLRSRNCALPDYCHARIFGGREAARARTKVANGQLVADLCRARFDVLQAVVTHWALLCRPQPT